MHAFRPEIARHGLRQNALRRLGRRESGEARLAAPRRRIAGDDERAVARLDHRRNDALRERHQRRDVDAEVLLQPRRVGFQRREKPARHRIVDGGGGRAHLFRDAGAGCAQPVEIAHVAGVAARAGNLRLQPPQPLLGARQQGHAVSAAREAARAGGARAVAGARDNADFLAVRDLAAHGRSPCRCARSARSRDRRTFPASSRSENGTNS